jgi:hypothetical protein
VFNKKEFANFLGIDIKRLNSEIKAGNIYLSNSKIDPQHPKNSAFMDEIKREKYGSLNDDDEIPSDLELQKSIQEYKYKKEQALSLKQKRLTQLGILVHRETFERQLAKFGQGLKTHVNSLPRRITPTIFSMVKSGKKESEIEKYIANEIEEALRRAKG